MLRVLGSSKRFCNGITRRDALWAGGLSLFGLGLSDYLRVAAQATDSEQHRKNISAKPRLAFSSISMGRPANSNSPT